MRAVNIAAIFFFGAVACTLAGAEQPGPKPAADLPRIKELPNPFLFADGSPVKNKEDWDKRRLEVKELFQDYMYGHMPPKPQKMTIKKGEKVTDEANKIILQELELQLEHEGKKLTINATLALPMNAKGKVPVIIQSSFGFGGSKSGKRFTTFTNQGYAVAEFRFNQVASDNKDKARSSGLYKLFGDKIDCGALMAWAWGVSRVIDALDQS